MSAARPLLVAAAILAAASCVPAGARAQDQPSDAPSAAAAEDDDDAPPEGVYARVIVDRTTMRSGPGAAFRALRTAHRGDVYPIVERGTRGYWFRVELPDGTFAWISGDAVYTHELSSSEAHAGQFLPEVFAPAPLPQATGEIAFQFGALGFRNGFMAIRPSVQLSPEFAIEATAAAAVGQGGRLLIGTLGGVVNVFPDSPIVPFLALGGGFVISDPNADTFLLRSGFQGALQAGGGLRIAFRYRITLRLEARTWVFFDENRYVQQEELSAGLTVFY